MKIQIGLAVEEMKLGAHDADNPIGLILDRISWPITLRSPPKRRIQNEYRSRTTLLSPPFLSSSSVNGRPSMGCAPSRCRKPGVTA